MAAVRSSWSLLARVTDVAFLGRGIALDGAGNARSLAPSRWGSEVRLLGASCLLALRFLALALDAGLLVVLASASLRQNAALLDLLIEASQRTLEGLVFAYADFSQSGITSHRHDSGPHQAREPGYPSGMRAAT